MPGQYGSHDDRTNRYRVDRAGRGAVGLRNAPSEELVNRVAYGSEQNEQHFPHHILSPRAQYDDNAYKAQDDRDPSMRADSFAECRR